MSQLATPPYALQANTVSMGAQLFREAISSLIGPAGGVVSPGDLAVTQNGTPNMSVNVAAGQVWIPGSQAGTLPSGAQIQGLYYTQATAVTNLAIAAANPTNPRIDQVIAQVQDAAYAGSANQCQLAIITGTPTAGASLSNLVGLGTFPPANSSALLLAYVLVPANATSIVTADISNVASVVSRANGSWQALTLATNITAFSYTPSARLEGDVVRLKGGLTNGTGGGLGTGSLIATIPAGLGLRPSATVGVAALLDQSSTSGGALTINTSGQIITRGGTWTNALSCNLDGITYSLS